MSKRKQKKINATKYVPSLVDVTIGGVTLGFTEDESVDPNDYVTLKEFSKMVDKFVERVDEFDYESIKHLSLEDQIKVIKHETAM